MHPAEREDSAEFSKLEDISALGVFHVNSKALITEAGTNCRPDIETLEATLLLHSKIFNVPNY